MKKEQATGDRALFFRHVCDRRIGISTSFVDDLLEAVNSGFSSEMEGLSVLNLTLLNCTVLTGTDSACVFGTSGECAPLDSKGLGQRLLQVIRYFSSR